MSKPRIFISSTFYDFKQIRSDIEKFIRDLGYEPVLHETGAIPYGKDEPLEEYCYREVTLCDIIVVVLGGHFGTEAKEGKYSITQKEIKTAIDAGKKVYIFISKEVEQEYNFWIDNRDVEGIKYREVDDTRIFEFIEGIKALTKNNQIATFETAQDIIRILKEQWAGLFQRFLQNGEKEAEAKSLQNINKTAQTLNELVEYFKMNKQVSDKGFEEVLMNNHPVFTELAKITRTSYRIYFLTLDEMNIWLNARGWKSVDSQYWDDDSYMEYSKEKGNNIIYLHVHNALFDEEGKLKRYSSKEWEQIEMVYATEEVVSGDDEIPF